MYPSSTRIINIASELLVFGSAAKFGSLTSILNNYEYSNTKRIKGIPPALEI